MKTSKLITAIITFNVVIFMSFTSIANSRTSYSGDLTSSGNKNMNIANASEKDYSYLRFDVNNFINENESEAIELPVANEFEYLRFDVNNFTESNTTCITELPVNEFDYLRFDVNNYTTLTNNAIGELPLTE